MEKKLYHWLEKQLINQDTYDILLKEIKEEAEHRRKVGLNITLYIIGIILTGIGIASFIAANDWLLEFLNKNEIIKILLASCISILSLYFGYKLAYIKQNYIKFGKALICLSSLLIGSTYMLIGQIYNINAHNSSLMFLWAISIFPLAYIFREKFINCLATGVFIAAFLLHYAELALDNRLVWTIFMPIILGSFLYFLGNINPINKQYKEFAVFYKLLGLKSIFITLLILTCSVQESYQIHSWQYYLPLIILTVGFFINILTSYKKNTLHFTENIYFFILLSVLLTTISIDKINTIFVMFLAHSFLITMFGFAIHYGYKFENIKLISMTHGFIGIYLFVMFCRYGWNFFDKTIFFLLSGIILITMGILYEKKIKKIIKGFSNE